MKKRIGTFVIVTLVLLFVGLGYRYLHYRSTHAVSDAAFIKSDQLAMLSFKVGGKVVELYKSENDTAQKGTLLARIDPTDFLVTKEKILRSIQSFASSIEALKLKKARLRKSLALQRSIAATDITLLDHKAAALAFRIDGAKTRLKKAQKDRSRYAKMLKERLIAPTEYEAIATNVEALQEEIEAMQKELAAVMDRKRKALDAHQLAIVQSTQIAELDQQIKAKKEQLLAQKKALEAIDNKIAYTKLYAPFDGIIAKKFTDAPRVVKKGAPIYALVDPKRLYCEVLLSEKKLHGVKVGNRVQINVDALPDRTFQGSVASIAPTSASTFSLVPRDIASGEFTKLDQRFIVRIDLENSQGLRAGMGATVAIERE